MIPREQRAFVQGALWWDRSVVNKSWQEVLSAITKEAARRFPEVVVTGKAAATYLFSAEGSTSLIELIRDITHPHEGPCPLCFFLFDTHNEGCPYQKIDDVITEFEQLQLSTSTEADVLEQLCEEWEAGPCVRPAEQLRAVLRKRRRE